MEWIRFDGSDAPTRVFICTSPNQWGFPAKDRSGRLDQIEEPNLQKLLRKMIVPVTDSPAKAVQN